MNNRKSILVVNDEEDMLTHIERWLLMAGFTVKCTITAEKGLQLFKEAQFDLVLMDFNLKKERNGSKTAKLFIPMFKKINPLIPIIIISATEPNLKKEDLNVSAVFIVQGSLWKNLPLAINRVLQNNVCG